MNYRNHYFRQLFVFLGSLAIFASTPVFGEPSLRLIDPWVRAVPPGAQVTAGYLTLANEGSTDDTLLSVTSPSVKTVEIHKTSEKDGMMRMEKIENLSVAANERVQLQPGGYHLMLIGVQETQEVKKNWVTLTLKFAKSGEMEFKAPLRAITRQATSGSSKKSSKQ